MSDKVTVVNFGHPDDYQLKSSLKELENFLDGFIWQDFLGQIAEREELLKNQIKTISSLEDLKKLQGELESLDFIRSMPDRMREELNFDKDA